MEPPVPPVRDPDDFLVFGSPLVGEAEVEEVVDSLRRGWPGTGPKAARFEEAFRAYKGAAHAAGVSSGTAALHLAMLAAGVGPGDEVVTTALTFCATVNAILHTGATPVLADVDPETMNLDPERLREAVGPRTRAVLPVHFAGRPCEMDGIMEIAAAYDLVVIEDCAHAIETEYRGRKAGTIGDFGCFSFYVTKNVITGEGGMVLARRGEDVARIRVRALHGLSADAWRRHRDEGYRHYEVVDLGFKYNLTDLQAAIGLHQLARVEECHGRRREIRDRYDEAFADLPLTRPAPPAPDTRHALHLYPILVDGAGAGIGRDEFLEGMTRNGVGVGVHYRSIPEHRYYRERFGWRPEDHPHAMRIGRQTVSLPFSAKLADRDVEDVIEAVRRLVRTGAPRRPH